MPTSDRTVVGEAAAAAAITVAAVALAAPDDPWLVGVALHPAWLPVIILAARYGSRGLFAALAFTGAGLTAADVALGGSLAGAAGRGGGADVAALAAATLVAWIAMLHETRLAQAAEQLTAATDARRQAEDTVRALHASLDHLRRRHDRLDVSLSLWREVAGRLERGDPGEAARAALELCELRVGASSGIVQLRDGNRLNTLASRGQLSPGSARPRDIAGDDTVNTAIVTRRVATAAAGASADASDLAAPVIDEETGVVLGVIALRGVGEGALRAAELSDLRLIAQWLAPALARPLQLSAPRPRLAMGGSSDFDES